MSQKLNLKTKFNYLLIYVGLMSLGFFIPLKISLGINSELYLAIVDLILTFTLLLNRHRHRHRHSNQSDNEHDLLFFMSHQTKNHSKYFLSMHKISYIPFETLIYISSFFFDVPEWFRFLSLFRVFQVIDFYYVLHWLAKPIQVFFIFSFLLMLTHWITNGWLLIELPNAPHVFDKYIMAMYWTITTLATVGYGDVTPLTTVGRIYAMCIMMIGVSSFAIVVSHFSRLLIKSDKRKEEKHTKIKTLHFLLNGYQVPQELQTQVYSFYSHYLDKKGAEDEEKMLLDLPHVLRTEIGLYMKIHFIKDLPIFRDLDISCLKEIAHHLEQRYYSVHDKITRVGDEGDGMYIIASGEVDIEKEGKVIATLKGGQIFGEMAFIEKTKRSANVISKTYTDIWVLKKRSFELMCPQFPQLSDRFHEIYRQRTKKE